MNAMPVSLNKLVSKVGEGKASLLLSTFKCTLRKDVKYMHRQ